MKNVIGSTYKKFDVLLEPVVSEKAFREGQGGNVLIFKVNPKSTKADIKAAVEEIFGVKVRKVTTANYLGKTRRSRTGVLGRNRSYKKAIIRLAEGYRVNLFEG